MMVFKWNLLSRDVLNFGYTKHVIILVVTVILGGGGRSKWFVGQTVVHPQKTSMVEPNNPTIFLERIFILQTFIFQFSCQFSEV